MKDKENFAGHQEQKANYIKGEEEAFWFLIRKSKAKKTMKWQLQRSQRKEKLIGLYISRFAPRHLSGPGGVVPSLCVKSRDMRASFFIIVQSPLRRSRGPRTTPSFCSSELSRTPKRASFINTVVPSLDTHLENHLWSFEELYASRPHTLRFWVSHSGVGGCCCSAAQECLTLWPHGLQPARLPCPSPSPWFCPSSCLLNR